MSCLLNLAAISGLLVAEPPAAAQSTVELRVTSVDDGEAKLLEHVLMGQLGDRLLEDGYRVVPVGDPASVRVWIHIGADEATIEARGAGHQVERIADGDVQVMALELQQLTTALVDEVRPTAAQPRTAIVIEVVGEGRDPQLHQRLQTGLLERGFALTRLPNEDDVRLCVATSSDGVFVHAVAGTDACAASADATRVGEAASLEIERELVLDEASASVERFIAASNPEPSVTIAEPTTAVVPAGDADPSSVPDTRAEAKRASVMIGASGGVLGRAGGADPVISVDLRAGRRRGIGGSLDLALVPSRSEALRVLEYVPTASLDWRLGFADRGLAILAVVAGAHVHTYAYEGAPQRGVRVGPSVGASVRLAAIGRRGAMVFGGVRAGWSGGGWTHLADGEPSWRRSSVMVGIEVGAGWDFLLRGRR